MSIDQQIKLTQALIDHSQRTDRRLTRKINKLNKILGNK